VNTDVIHKTGSIATPSKEDRARATDNMRRDLPKFGSVVFKLCERTDRQTDTFVTQHHSTPLPGRSSEVSCCDVFGWSSEDGVCSGASDHGGNAEGTEFWGYVHVRPGAHTFYWLYRSSHADGYLQRPLIMWLQVTRKLYRPSERRGKRASAAFGAPL